MLTARPTFKNPQGGLRAFFDFSESLANCRIPGVAPGNRGSLHLHLCNNPAVNALSDDRAYWLAKHVLPHEAALRSWLRRRRVLHSDVDDIVQETYAVLVGLAGIDHIRNARSYLFSVANSIILQQLRRQRIVSIESVLNIDRLGVASETSSPEHRAAEVQELRHIGELVASLPAKCREAFILRKVEGLSQREVAERMRVSENTIEKHVGKALRFLMAAMADKEMPQFRDDSMLDPLRRATRIE